MSDASDRTIPEQPLTRRELRERERLTLRPREETEPAPTEAAPTEPAATEPASTEPALSPADELLISDELHAPGRAPAVLTESDRAIAAPPAEEIPADTFGLLLTPVPTTTSTRVPIPTVSAPTEVPVRTASTPTDVPPSTRAGLRAEEHAARAGRARRPRAESHAAGPREPQASFAPTRTFVPSTTPPRASGSPRRSSDRVRKLAAKGATIVAMAFVALMAVSTSVPAAALLSSSDVQASALAAQRPSSSEPTQRLDLAGGDTVTVERDGYESSTIAEVAAASGIRMEATFTNNPSGTVQWPFAVGVHIGSKFGFRDCAGCSANHQGQDFNPGIGAPIQSIADGVVSVTEDGEGSLGVHMMIDHMIDGKKVTSVYAHMIHGSMLLKTGDVVKVGQVIGKTGTTGMSTGPHLHFEIRLGGKDGQHVDPLEWLYANTN